jgi:hypothetical protein
MPFERDVCGLYSDKKYTEELAARDRNESSNTSGRPL